MSAFRFLFALFVAGQAMANAAAEPIAVQPKPIEIVGHVAPPQAPALATPAAEKTTMAPASKRHAAKQERKKKGKTSAAKKKRR